MPMLYLEDGFFFSKKARANRKARAKLLDNLSKEQENLKKQPEKVYFTKQKMSDKEINECIDRIEQSFFNVSLIDGAERNYSRNVMEVIDNGNELEVKLIDKRVLIFSKQFIKEVSYRGIYYNHERNKYKLFWEHGEGERIKKIMEVIKIGKSIGCHECELHYGNEIVHPYCPCCGSSLMDVQQYRSCSKNNKNGEAL